MLGAWDALVSKTPCLHVAYSLKVLVNLIPRTKKWKTQFVVSALVLS